MCSICGLDCCKECSRREECGGCQKVDGHPFGGTCIAAECIKRGGQEEFLKLKDTLISEFHALGIEGLEVKELHLLNGFFVNLEYPLANGQSVKLLEDRKSIWEIRSKGLVRTAAMELSRMNLICLYANTAAMVQILKLSYIKSTILCDAFGMNSGK